MAKVPFKQALAGNLNLFYDSMSKSPELRANLYEAVSSIESSDEFDEEQSRSIKFGIECLTQLYHICDRDQIEFNFLTGFLNPPNPE